MVIGFTLYLQGFQLTDFSEKASFKSLNKFATFLHTAAILETQHVVGDPLPFTQTNSTEHVQSNAHYGVS